VIVEISSRKVLASLANLVLAKKGNLAQWVIEEDEMTATDRLFRGSTTTKFPPLRQPKPETADHGIVRFGDGCITAEFPPLRQPKPETADHGTVRFGDGCITAEFPPRR
jgi:hypothetical protein